MRVTEVEKCQAELGQTQNQLGASHAREDQLKKEREERDDEIARLHADAAKLASNLQATQNEMEALRRVHAQAEQRNELYRTLVARLRDAIGAGTLAVEVRKGKMLVKLGDAILFDPGQATLKTDGQRALRAGGAGAEGDPRSRLSRRRAHRQSADQELAVRVELGFVDGARGHGRALPAVGGRRSAAPRGGRLLGVRRARRQRRRPGRALRIAASRSW